MSSSDTSHSIRAIWQLTTFTVLAAAGYGTATVFSLPFALLSPEAAEIAMFILGAAATLGVTCLVLLWFHNLPLRAVGIGFDRPWITHTAIGLVLGGALITLVWVVFQLGGWLKAELRPGASAHGPRFCADLLLCFAVAAHEEILCRGYAFQVLYRRSKSLAFILPGLVFVALHWFNTGGSEPLALCNLFLAHVFFAVCYLRTRSLWFPIAVHAGWNFVMADALGLPVSGNAPEASLLSGQPVQNLLTGFSFGPEGGFLVSLILLAGTFAIWRFVRQRQPAVDLVSAPDPPLVRESLLAPAPAGIPSRAPAGSVGGELTPALARPTQSAERVLAIDVLRGVAVLSILPMNMEIFALVPQAVIHPYAGLFTDSTNVIAWVALRVLIGSIGLSLFSLLFGAGLLLFEGSHKRSAESATALHYRRLAVLAVIGFAHAYLIWAGDILVTYAIIGSLIWLFRRMRPGTLITLGSLAFAVPMVLLLAAHFLAPHFSEQTRLGLHNAILPNAKEVAHLDQAYRAGWLGQMGQRFSDAVSNQTFNLVLCMGWIAGGMMLLGMGLQKLGVLTAQASRRAYWLMLALAALVGYPLLAGGLIWCFRHDWQVPDGFFLGWAMRETAYPLIMMGWIGAVMLICKAGALKPLTSRLAATGQMALSNYLVQSILCHLIFYGTGLALVDKVSIPAQIIITLAIWTVQLLYSPMWLARYRFGPAEWLWRSLSYGRWFDLRVVKPSDQQVRVPAMSEA